MNQRTYYSQEAEMRAQRERTLLVFAFMALGLGIGAALALLFAPKTGEQIRGELAHTFTGELDAGRDTLHRLEKDVNDLRKKVEDRLGDIR